MAKVWIAGPDSVTRIGAEFYQTTVSPVGDKVLQDVATSSLAQATRLDEASATVTYVGKAKVGAAEGSALWQISKIEVSSGTLTSITWADGNANFDNIWSDRASLSYS